jgi:hypothetical protein
MNSKSFSGSSIMPKQRAPITIRSTFVHCKTVLTMFLKPLSFLLLFFISVSLSFGVSVTDTGASEMTTGR